MFKFSKKRSSTVSSSTDTSRKSEIPKVKPRTVELQKEKFHSNVGKSSSGSATLGALEPFQEVVDETLNLDFNQLQGDLVHVYFVLRFVFYI